MALFSQGHMEEAIGHLRRALQLDPDAFALHNDLGVALGARGRLDEAITHFRLALQIDPDFAEAKANLGRRVAATRPVGGETTDSSEVGGKQAWPG